jgi:hypothetical protein
VAVLRALEAVVDDPGGKAEDHGPVEGVHSASPRRHQEKYPWNAYSARRVMTHTMSTRA